MSSPAVEEAVAERLAGVRQRIARACARVGRDPAAVTIVAVSKGHPAKAVAAAARVGLSHFGENRVQEALPKIEALRAAGVSATWHLVGHLQSNKARVAAAAFPVIHSVDSERLLARLDSLATAPVDVLLQLNLAAEPQKHGVLAGQLPALVAAARALAQIRLQGLMTIAPYVADAEEVRPVFRELSTLAQRFELDELSMGMTDDLEVAVEEGATLVRVGRALFGERSP